MEEISSEVQGIEIVTIDSEYYLGEPGVKDIPELVKYLNDEEVYRNTIKIPKPYTNEDGIWYVNFCQERKKMFGRTMEWCIRNKKGELIGGIGLQGSINELSHREIIGYWLARPYRNQRVMSRALVAFCKYVFKRDKIVRLEAHVYFKNIASCRLLEKAGFVKEGLMKKFILKDGQYMDACLYALVK